jgi:hypothetical protein
MDLHKCGAYIDDIKGIDEKGRSVTRELVHTIYDSTTSRIRTVSKGARVTFGGIGFTTNSRIMPSKHVDGSARAEATRTRCLVALVRQTKKGNLLHCLDLP